MKNCAPLLPQLQIGQMKIGMERGEEKEMRKRTRKREGGETGRTERKRNHIRLLPTKPIYISSYEDASALDDNLVPAPKPAPEEEKNEQTKTKDKPEEDKLAGEDKTETDEDTGEDVDEDKDSDCIF